MHPVHATFPSAALATVFAGLAVALGGVLTAGNAVAATPVQPSPPPPAPPKFWFNAVNSTLQTSPTSPGDGWMEVDKTKYDALTLAFGGVASTASSPSTATPAAAPPAAPLADPFGDGNAPVVQPMTLASFSEKLKALSNNAEFPNARPNFTKYLASKNMVNISALTAGKTDAELGPLFAEVSAAMRA